MKLKATITLEYEIADENLEDWYETTNPNKICNIDQDNFNSNPANLIDLINSCEYSVKVEPAK